MEWQQRKICSMFFKNDASNIYWTIPIGNLNHRYEKAKIRSENYLKLDKKDIRSYFYHIGKTTVKSIFFISGIIPVVDKYIRKRIFYL